MFFYSKEMSIFLNDLYNINYAAMLIFFKIIILFKIISEFFPKIFISFFITKNTALYYPIKSLKLFRNLTEFKIIIYYY